MIAALADRQHGFVAHSQLLALGLSRFGDRSPRGHGAAAPPLSRRLHGRASEDGHRRSVVGGCARVRAGRSAQPRGRGRSVGNRPVVRTARDGDPERPRASAWHRRPPSPRRSRGRGHDAARATDHNRGAHAARPRGKRDDGSAARGARSTAQSNGGCSTSSIYASSSRAIPDAPERFLKALLASYSGPLDTRSVLEELVIELCDAHGLPRPLVNCVIEGKVRDFCWPSWQARRGSGLVRVAPLAVALDDDRERDVELFLAGWRVCASRTPGDAAAIVGRAERSSRCVAT